MKKTFTIKVDIDTDTNYRDDIEFGSPDSGRSGTHTGDFEAEISIRKDVLKEFPASDGTNHSGGVLPVLMHEIGHAVAFYLELPAYKEYAEAVSAAPDQIQLLALMFGLPLEARKKTIEEKEAWELGEKAFKETERWALGTYKQNEPKSF